MSLCRFPVLSIPGWTFPPSPLLLELPEIPVPPDLGFPLKPPFFAIPGWPAGPPIPPMPEPPEIPTPPDLGIPLRLPPLAIPGWPLVPSLPLPESPEIPPLTCPLD